MSSAVGVTDFETLVPAQTVSRQDLVRWSGLEPGDLDEILPASAVSVFDADIPDWRYAAQVAATVIERQAVDTKRIGWVIYCGSGVWDAPFWSPAAKVASELGLTYAHCFEVVNFCNAGATGLSIARDKVSARPGHLALVIICDRLSRVIDRSDAQSRALFNFGDSATALVVGTDRPLLTLRGDEMRTDPSWCDMYRGQLHDGRTLVRKHYERRGLKQRYIDAFVELLGLCLAGAAVAIDQLRYLLINQGDRDVHESLLKNLDLPAERSVFNYHLDGHLGGGDNWIALRQLFQAGRLRRGDIVAMATSAMGFSWGMSLLEVSQ
ncbi:3-oxoacyl-ACP synthase III family protein [Burkholderia sp. LMG 21824]|uniref:3-oxoacyl-ACP synthase III family protein n=1 Tax=Burkholderia sp. LMG 21824 TaxID=3158172 RepID=UPI003C301A66